MDIIEIEGIGNKYKEKLEKVGIDTVEKLLERGKTPESRKEIVDATGISPELIIKWVYLADLIRIDGVGEEYSDLLQAAGINTVKDLTKQYAKDLFKRIVDVNKEKELVRQVPTIKMVEGWVSQAKKLPIMVILDETQIKKEPLTKKRPLSLLLITVFSSLFVITLLITSLVSKESFINSLFMTLTIFCPLALVISIILIFVNRRKDKIRTRTFGFAAMGAFVLLILSSAMFSLTYDIKTITETPKNNPPIAVAGEDISCYTGDDIKLSGSGSSDPENDNLTYEWNIDGQKFYYRNISCYFDEAGVYSVVLTVSDGEFSSGDTIRITVDKKEVAVEEEKEEEKTTEEATTSVTSTGPLKVHFINVGQGDSTLIQTPEGNVILIDGGPTSSSSNLVSYLKNNDISKINVVVATHPNEDHIGGLINVLNSFTVDNIIDSGVSHTTKTYENYLTTIQSKDINLVNWSVGQAFDVGNNVSMKIIGPTSKSSDLNNSSIVILVSYKNSKFLFTGDAESEEEIKIVSSGAVLKADVLKVGHHGSSSSCCTQFLNAVSPAVAVISCGANNGYGHPHEITLENLTNIGATIYRTDLTGTIVIESDGYNINIKKGEPYTYVKTETEETTQDEETTITETVEEQPSQTGDYVGSKKSDVFHKPSCGYVKNIKPENIICFSSREDAIAHGYRL